MFDGSLANTKSITIAEFPILRSDVRYGEQWLHGLNAAAVKLGVPVQFCMSYPRFILEALKLPAVTNARASDDFNVDGPAYQYPGGGDINNNLKPFVT